jgi:circadian clock protein KaiB
LVLKDLDPTAELQLQFADGEAHTMQLTLFVAGASPNSLRAITNITNFCESYLKDRVDLKIVDVHQQPLFAQSEQIIALPLLIKKFPEPKRRLIGDMSDTDKLISGLGLVKI